MYIRKDSRLIQLIKLIDISYLKNTKRLQLTDTPTSWFQLCLKESFPGTPTNATSFYYLYSIWLGSPDTFSSKIQLRSHINLKNRLSVDFNFLYVLSSLIEYNLNLNKVSFIYPTNLVSF